jgi:hypothetical protein
MNGERLEDVQKALLRPVWLSDGPGESRCVSPAYCLWHVHVHASQR